MKTLSIIVVNYNVKEFLLNLLKSVKYAVKGISNEIIVVDNASEDGSVDAVKKKFPYIKIIKNERNLGFGSANNIALEKAEGKYIVFINPDAIVKEDTFKIMLNFFQRTPDAGMAGCKVLNPDGTLQLACRRSFPGPWTSFTKVTGLSSLFSKSKLLARYNLTYLDENQTYEVDAISGSFMMMKKEVYKKVGGFDPQFFMYGEDLDLCYRIQHAGYKVYYVHSTQIIHYKGESTKRSNLDETKMFYDAMHLFVKKHLSSSFIVEIILRSAIIVRKLFAFANVYRIIITAISLDFILYMLAVILAEKLYSPGQWSGFPNFVKPWVYIMPAVMQILISSFSGAYKKNSLSVLRSLIAIITGFIFLSSLTFFFKQFAFSRAVVLITYSLSLVMFVLWRVIAKLFFKFGIISETGKIRTLVVGINKNASYLGRKLKSNLTELHHVVGLISLENKDIGKHINEFEILGSLQNIKKIIVDNRIDKVIFSSGDISYDQLFSIVSECQGEKVEFMVAGSELDYLVGKSSVTMLDHIPLLTIHYNISSFSYKVTKSLFDFMFSLPILLLLYPFIYFSSKFKRNKGDFIKFFLQIPEVLIGRKSIVGPNDESTIGELYLGKIGLTGLWYTELIDLKDKDEINKLNIFYARNQNVWLDLEILGKTFAKMFIMKEK